MSGQPFWLGRKHQMFAGTFYNIPKTLEKFCYYHDIEKVPPLSITSDEHIFLETLK